MNRQAQAVVMLLFGGAVLKASVTDSYLRYVKEGLRPFLVAASVLLIVAAATTLWYELRPRAGHAPGTSSDTGDEQAAEDGAGHGHGHAESRVGWLLILPALALLLVAPPPLGAHAAGQAGTVLTAENQASDYPPLPAGEPVPVSLLDYASRAVFDDGRSLGDRTVALTGFITVGPDGQPMLARMVLSCCAADGRPIKVGLAGKAPAGVPADTWVRVEGRYTARRAEDPVNGAAVPYLEVATWQQVQEPKDPYE